MTIERENRKPEKELITNKFFKLFFMSISAAQNFAKGYTKQK